MWRLYELNYNDFSLNLSVMAFKLLLSFMNMPYVLGIMKLFVSLEIKLTLFMSKVLSIVILTIKVRKEAHWRTLLFIAILMVLQ